MLLPLLAAVLTAEPSLPPPPPSPPPLVPTEAAQPLEAAPPPPPVVLEKRKPPRSAKRALTIAGVSVFGASYALSLGVAAISELTARGVPVFPAQTSPYTGLFVPVVGPIIAAADFRNASNPSFVALMIADTLTQAAGLTFLIVGLAMPAPAKPSQPTVWLAPSIDAHGAGASLSGTF